MADTFAAVCNHLKQKGGKDYRQCEKIIMIIMINRIIMIIMSTNIGTINLTISSRRGIKITGGAKWREGDGASGIVGKY